MVMRVDWALLRWAPTYGYSQVAGSLRDERISAQIAKWSDVPSGGDSPELPKYAWAMWPLDDHYVVVRSVPDHEEDRGGGYISKALILPANEAAQWPTLKPVFDLFERPERFWTAQGQQPVEMEAVPAASAVLPAVTALLGAYAKRGVNRVVLLDSPQTPALVDGLWQVLWPAAQLQLSVKTYFMPTQVPQKENRPQLVLSPSSVARWEAQGYDTVAPTAPALRSVWIDHLTGSADALATMLLTGFPGGLTDLPLLTVLYDQVDAALGADDTWSVLMALDTLNSSHIAVESQANITRQLYQALSRRVAQLPVTELLLLNRLSDPPALLVSAVVSWVTDRLFFLTELPAVLKGARQAWFRDAIVTGLMGMVPSNVAATQVWSSWPLLADHDLLAPFLTTAWDSTLAQAFPPAPPADLRTLALEHTLLATYAALVGRQAHPVALADSLRELSMAQQAVVWPALQAQWGVQGFVHASAELDDSVLDPVIASLLERRPDAVQPLDPTRPAWRRWWTQRVLGGVAVWDHIPDAVSVLDALLRLDPSVWPLPVLNAIAATPQANLLEWPRRKLWAHLPDGFVQTTARAWLAADASPEDIDCEVLREALRQIDVQVSREAAFVLLRRGPQDMSTSTLDLLLQRAAAPWPDDLTGLLQERAIQGQLVQRWFDHTQSGRYVFPGVFFELLVDHLRLMQQVRHLRTLPGGVPVELWWQALREKSLQTFGGELDRVWDDIGGKAKHLRDHGSREDRWFAAVIRIRETGKPKFGDLLKQIGAEDHQSDDSKVLWETRPHQ